MIIRHKKTLPRCRNSYLYPSNSDEDHDISIAYDLCFFFAGESIRGGGQSRGCFGGCREGKCSTSCSFSLASQKGYLYFLMYVCMGVTIVAGTHAQWVEVCLIISRKDTGLASESSEAQSGVLFVSRHIAVPL